MYKPLQKKNSSWTPTTAQKKSKSPSKLGHFSIQPKSNKKSSQPQEIGEYSRDSADRLAANVMRSLETKDSQDAETPTVQPQSESRISVADVVGQRMPNLTPHTLSPLQRKLTVGQPGDKYEQEADTVAAKVVEQINSPTSQQSVQGKVEPVAQPTVMRDGGVSGGAVDASIEQSIQQATGGGQGLSEDVREPMEQAFGADFSGVKIHTDGNANQLNRSLNARAFTTGPDIFFKQGEYNPGSRDGQELLAHELTHVVQQKGISHIQRESAPSNHEKMLDEAINIVQHALNAFAAQTTGEDNADMTATPQVKQQEQGLRTALNHLLALKGSDKVDDIISATRPILAASKGDSAGASPPSIGEPSPQESSEGLTPNVQRAATLALGAPLLAAGPPGWAAYAALAVGTLIVGGIIAHEMSRTRTKPRAVPRTRTRRRRRGPYPINWPYLGGRGLPLVAPNPANSISIGRRLVRTTPPPRNRALIDLFKATNTVQTGQAVHHVTPLFLGGPDALGNLAAVWISYHIAGHNALNNQPHLAAYGISPYLPNHPPGTPYIVSAIKNSR